MQLPLKRLKVMTRDLVVIAGMAAVGLGCGLALNALREKPLPLVYLPKAERLQQAVEQLLPQAGQSTSDSKVGHLELPAFREIVEKKADGIVLDARPEVFYKLGHVPGAISLPRDDFQARYGQVKALLERDRTQRIIVYCSGSDCEDSQLVADALVKLAYPRVFIFKGGWDAWTEADLPEEKTQP